MEVIFTGVAILNTVSYRSAKVTCSAQLLPFVTQERCTLIGCS